MSLGTGDGTLAHKTLFAFKGVKAGLSSEEYAQQHEREDREAADFIAAAKVSKPAPVQGHTTACYVARIRCAPSCSEHHAYPTQAQKVFGPRK